MKISIKKLRDDCGSYYDIDGVYSNKSIFKDFEDLKTLSFIDGINFFYNLFFPKNNNYYTKSYRERFSDKIFTFLNNAPNKKLFKKEEEILPFLESFVLKNFNEYMEKNKNIVENIVEKGRLDNLSQLFNFDKILKLDKIYKGKIKMLPNIKLSRYDSYDDDQIVNVPDNYLSLLGKTGLETDGVDVDLWKIKDGGYSIEKETHKVSFAEVEKGLDNLFYLWLNIAVTDKSKMIDCCFAEMETERDYNVSYKHMENKNYYFTTEEKAVEYLSEKKKRS